MEKSLKKYKKWLVQKFCLNFWFFNSIDGKIVFFKHGKIVFLVGKELYFNFYLWKIRVFKWKYS